MVSGTIQGKRGLGKLRLLLPFAVAVRLVAKGAAVIPVDPHGAVTVVAVIGAAGCIYRDLVVIYAEAVALCITVGEQSSLEHLVRRESYAGHDMGRVEGRLFDLCKIVLRVAVKLKYTHLDQGIILFQPYLREVKGVKMVCCSLFLGHYLDKHGPAREIPLLNASVEIPLMALAALANGRLSLCIGQVLYPLLGAEMELHPVPFPLCVDKAERVAPEAVHVAVGSGDAPVAHDDGDLVERLRQGAPEIPVVEGAAQVCARVALDRVVEVREFKRVAEEEHRRVVPNEVPVSLFGVKLDREAADVPLRVGGATFPCYCREAGKEVCLLPDPGEYLRLGIACNVMGNGKRAVGAGAFRVHTAFRDHLPVKVGELLQEPDILQQLRPTRPCGHNILVVNNRGAAPCGKLFLFFLLFCHLKPPFIAFNGRLCRYYPGPSFQSG